MVHRLRRVRRPRRRPVVPRVTAPVEMPLRDRRRRDRAGASRAPGDDVAGTGAGPAEGEVVVPSRDRDPSRRARRAAEQADAYLAARRHRLRQERPGR